MLPRSRNRRPPVEVGQLAAGLLDQERARRDVPGGEAELEEAVEDSGGDHREVERRRPGAADGARLQEELPEEREVQVDLVARAEGKSRREEGAVDALRAP